MSSPFRFTFIIVHSILIGRNTR